MKIHTKRLLPLALMAVLSSCTLNEGDPQTTLCQKLTAHLMSANNVQWKETSKTAGADKSILVTVRWDSKDSQGVLPMQASCHYPSNEDDAGEDFDVNVNDEYQSLPDSVVINGQQVRQQDLYTAIQKVTGIAVKETFNKEHLRKKAGEAAQAIQEGSQELRQKAGEAAQAIKEGSQELRQKAGEALQKAGEQLQK